MSGTFWPVTIDDSPQLLEESYRLRYQAYCLEQRFLSAEDYPNQLESDEFDRDSVHVGVLDAEGELAGTARMVMPNGAGLPLLRHCTLFSHATPLDEVGTTVAEISRVCISRRYTRRRADVCFGASEATGGNDEPTPVFERRHDRNDVFSTLVEATYHATKRLGVTHWIAAMEDALRRRTARLGLPFQVAGPEVDYYGLVTPYILSIAEFDRVIRGRRFAALNDFPLGLEPELRPRPDEHDAPFCHGAR
jgi:N-acyl amino acid synthase of PEP-CTERM/exosortase system